MLILGSKMTNSLRLEHFFRSWKILSTKQCLSAAAIAKKRNEHRLRGKLNNVVDLAPNVFLFYCL